LFLAPHCARVRSNTPGVDQQMSALTYTVQNTFIEYHVETVAPQSAASKTEILDLVSTRSDRAPSDVYWQPWMNEDRGQDDLEFAFMAPFCGGTQVVVADESHPWSGAVGCVQHCDMEMFTLQLVSSEARIKVHRRSLAIYDDKNPMLGAWLRTPLPGTWWDSAIAALQGSWEDIAECGIQYFVTGWSCTRVLSRVRDEVEISDLATFFFRADHERNHIARGERSVLLFDPQSRRNSDEITWIVDPATAPRRRRRVATYVWRRVGLASCQGCAP